MKTMIIVAALAVWGAGVYINAGFVLAYFQRKYPDVSKKTYRQDLAFAVTFSIIPLFWFVTHFKSQFYKHGWMRPTLRRPDATVDPLP